MTLPRIPESAIDLTAEQIAEIEASFEEQLVEDLGSIDFADQLPEHATPAQLDKAVPALLRYMLQAGADGGFKDGIDQITDEAGKPPAEANNWLMNEDGSVMSGRFIDRRPEGDRVFKFTMTRKGDEWERVFSPISGVSDAAS
jgi:hypothetical protein